MRRSSFLFLGWLAFGILAEATSTAEAQTTRPGTSPNQNVVAPSNPTSMGVAVYANPYVNPFMSPFAAQNVTSMNRNDLGLYLYAAQQGSMGIGTGRISGTRSDPRAAASKPSREISMPLASQVPGGNAASYFQRGAPANRQNSRYFQRQNSHFLSNGH